MIKALDLLCRCVPHQQTQRCLSRHQRLAVDEADNDQGHVQAECQTSAAHTSSVTEDDVGAVAAPLTYRATRRIWHLQARSAGLRTKANALIARAPLPSWIWCLSWVDMTLMRTALPSGRIQEHLLYPLLLPLTNSTPTSSPKALICVPLHVCHVELHYKTMVTL